MSTSTRILALTCLAAAATAAASLSAREAARTTTQSVELALLPPTRCPDAQDIRLCEVAGPRPWSEDERTRVQETLVRLGANELVRGVLAGARENGYRGLHRYFTDTKLDDRGVRVSKFGPGFVVFGSRIIGLTDAYFQMQDIRDAASGYRLGDLILLHELIHAYDDRKLSGDPGFASLTGWTLKDGRWEYGNRVALSDYYGIYAETLTLYARARFADAWQRDRSFAMALRFPVPTIQSLATPGESFADILAHLIVDTRAPSYLGRDVVAWFEDRIFPDLRQKAKAAGADATPARR